MAEETKKSFRDFLEPVEQAGQAVSNVARATGLGGATPSNVSGIGRGLMDAASGRPVPKELSQVGAGIRREIPNLVPRGLVEPVQTGVSFLEDTAKRLALGPGLSGPLSKRIIENPISDSLTGLIGASAGLPGIPAALMSIKVGQFFDSPNGLAISGNVQKKLAEGGDIPGGKNTKFVLDIVGRGTGLDMNEGWSNAQFLANKMTPEVFKDTLKTVAQTTSFVIGSQSTKALINSVKRKLVGTPLGKAVDNVKNKVEFDSKIRGGLQKAKSDNSNEFGKQIDGVVKNKPTTKVPTAETFQSFVTDMDAMDADGLAMNPGMKRQMVSTLRRQGGKDAELIIKYLENPTEAQNLNLREAQNLKNVISNLKGLKGRLKSGNFTGMTNGEEGLLDLRDKIALAQAEAFPQEMSAAKEAYASFLSRYDLVKNDFKPRNFLNIAEKGFKNAVVEDAVGKIFQGQGDLFKQLKNFTLTSKAINFGKTVAIGAATVAGLRFALGGNIRRTGGDPE